MVSGSFFNFPHHCIRAFLEIYYHFSYSHQQLFMKLGKITYADNRKNQLHFWERSAGHLDPDQSIKLEWNPRSLLVDTTKVQGIRCT